jgi:hypothetical protein
MATITRHFGPETFRGNWERRDSFIWFERPDDAEEYGLWVLSHRDSGLIDQSNGAVIRERLSRFVDSGDVNFFGCSHWLVGHTDEMAVRVYKPDATETTEAFDELAEIVEAIVVYPILGESDYAEREYASALQGINCTILGDVPEDAPADWREQVYSWLADNAPNELENSDDRGAFPAEVAVKRALIALGIAGPAEHEQEK